MAGALATMKAWLTGTRSATPALSAPPAPLQEPAAPATRTRTIVRRSFAAAEQSRLTASFGTDTPSLNVDLERGLRIMRARSRQLARNNDYVRKFLRMVQNHVVGPNGVALQVQAMRPDGRIDEADSTVCERAFARFSKKGVFEVSGRMSRAMVERLLVLQLARDGEFIVRRVRGKRVGPFGYALRIIDPVLLDDTYRADLGNGVKIRMGVEVDADNRPLAYHFLERNDHLYGGIGQKRVRVDAAEIWHCFIQEEPDQVRGYPWLATAMRRLNDLGGYEEAAVIAARVGASKMGFFSQPADQGPSDPTLLADDVQDGELMTEAEPGTFGVLPKGYEFQSFNPDYPHQNFGDFVKACLRGIASGIGVDYNTLSNDLEGVNYSSIRHGLLETREEWMTIQNWFVEAFHEQLYSEWLDYAFLAGQLDPLPYSKRDKFDAAIWQPRRWGWVDPKSDVEAKILEVEHGLNSYSGILRELGRDPEEVWRELESDRERLKNILPTNQPTTPGQPGVGASGGSNAQS